MCKFCEIKYDEGCAKKLFLERNTKIKDKIITNKTKIYNAEVSTFCGIYINEETEKKEALIDVFITKLREDGFELNSSFAKTYKLKFKYCPMCGKKLND